MKVDYQTHKEVKASVALKANSIFQAIEAMSPSEIKNWVDANVNNIDDVRKVLTILILGLKGGTR